MSSIPKSLPFKTDPEYDIINVLRHRHEIPYHSRPFMWTKEKYINVVVKEALKSWRANELHWLGFIIIYNGAANPAISDAQHRLTVCFLMIVALSQLLTSTEPLTWISKYGNDSILGTSVPEEDQKVLDKYEWKRYPNIESCYDDDFEALGNILNGIANPYPPSKKPPTNLYDAFAAVRQTVEEELSDNREMVNFLQFIHNNIKVTRMVIMDWQFTIRVFNSLNNIKMQVPPSILVKNVLATTMGDEYSVQIHTLFNKWEQDDKKKYERFIHTMVNIFTRRLMNTDEYERNITGILELAQVSGCPLTAFNAVVERTIHIQERLNVNPYKRLLDIVTNGHEIMSMCILPIAVIADDGEFREVERLIRILLSYAIRLGQPISFNPVAMQKYLSGDDSVSGVVSSFMQGKTTTKQTVDTICTKLYSWLEDNNMISSTSVIHRITSETYTQHTIKMARCMLLFKAELTDSHEARLEYDTIHIDHIYPKKPGTACPPLTNPNMRHCIGNLTPFIGKNSSGGLKGNSALGNKSFDKKVPEYKKSNIAMTRAVADRYGSTGFLDTQIQERTRELAEEIAALTAAELGL